MIALSTVTPNAEAQSLVREFQDAIQELRSEPKGTCKGIPYADLRTECERIGSDITKYCKGQLNCGGMDPKRTQALLEDLKTTRDIARAQKAELDRQRSSLTDETAKREADDKIKAAEDTIKDVEQKAAVLSRAIDDSTKLINDRVTDWTYCREYRDKMKKVFEEAIAKVKSEGDTAVVARGLERELASRLEATVSGHDRQIEQVNTIIQNCKDMLYDIGRLGRLSMLSALHFYVRNDWGSLPIFLVTTRRTGPLQHAGAPFQPRAFALLTTSG
jgi:chromosome segregation ATPase